MIDPRTDKAGEKKEAYCRRRWGGSGWAPEFRQWDWWPNTLNAHRLCVYLDDLDAARTDLSEREKDQRALALVKKFYELTYDSGANISTPAGAARALEELGFAKASDAVQWLERGGGRDKVVAGDTYAKTEMDINGVPHFVVSDLNGGRGQTLHGAQKPAAFLAAFQQVAQSKRTLTR